MQLFYSNESHDLFLWIWLIPYFLASLSMIHWHRLKKLTKSSPVFVNFYSWYTLCSFTAFWTEIGMWNFSLKSSLNKSFTDRHSFSKFWILEHQTRWKFLNWISRWLVFMTRRLKCSSAADWSWMHKIHGLCPRVKNRSGPWISGQWSVCGQIGIEDGSLK